MALPGKVPVLPGKLDQSLEDDEACRQLERAAGLVSDFASEMAVPTLDRLLAGATAPIEQSTAEAVGDIADEITRQTDLLYEEVARFLTLAPNNPS